MVDLKESKQQQGKAKPTGELAAEYAQWQSNDRRDLIPLLGYREYWYPVVLMKQVGKHPKHVKLLGTDLVFFRGKDAEVACISSICPHRGGNLAEGECHWEGTITCPYHGWTFGEHGELLAVLVEGDDSKLPELGIKPRMYPTRVLKGMVFVWMGEGDPVPIEEDIPPEVFREDAHIKFHLEYWMCNWRQSVENAADAHAPYVHRNSFRVGQFPISFSGPVGPRSESVNGRAAVVRNFNVRSNRIQGQDVYFTKLGHKWPKSHWRKLWTWMFKFALKRNLKAQPTWSVLTEKEQAEWGGSMLHLPGMVRFDNRGYTYTRHAIPATEDLTLMVYYHWSAGTSWIAKLWESFYWNIFHNWMHYTNFSRQDMKAVVNQHYDYPENFSSHDSPLVIWRKLCASARDNHMGESTSSAEDGQKAEQST
jgi:phenylpropionate dioxygenase-like ring-hydroxylating dioxygenase large terminal subunit